MAAVDPNTTGPNADSACAVAFRAHLHKLAPHRFGGLSTLIVVEDPDHRHGHVGAAMIGGSALQHVCAVKRTKHAATAASALDVYERGKGGRSGIRAERRGLAALVAWFDSPALRRRLDLDDEHDLSAQLRSFAAELVADALLAWGWWVEWWPRSCERKALQAERRASGAKPRSASRLIHGPSQRTIPWVARRTGLNERTLRRRCERGEIRPALLSGTARGEKPVWTIAINRLSADSSAEKEILQRLFRGNATAAE